MRGIPLLLFFASLTGCASEPMVRAKFCEDQIDKLAEYCASRVLAERARCAPRQGTFQ